MTVITISRETGSDGDLISQNVAQALNYSLVNKPIIERILNQYGMVTFNKVYNADQSIWDRFDMGKNEMVTMLNQIIRAFAKLDNSVIVGRGGFIVLNGYENVLNVCIEAPLEKRISNIMKEQNITVREEAEAIITQNDRVRKGFLQTYYGVKSTETNMFSMTINTGLVSTDVASKWIIEAAELLSKKEIDPKRSTTAIEIDPVLAASIVEMNAELKKLK